MEPPHAAVFDLDDTLADTSATVLRPALASAFRAMIAAGLDATPDQLAWEAGNLERESAGAGVFRLLARRFRASNPAACEAAALDAFYRTPRDGIRLRPGARELLTRLSALGVRTFLITFGDPDVQSRKILDLGIGGFFESVALVDLLRGPDKSRALAGLIEEKRLPADRTWVIGDRPDGEIAAGNRLGCVTVRVRYGEFAGIEPRSPVERADLEITSLRQLSRLL